MGQEIPENMKAITHCCVDGTEMQIDNIDQHPDGHVYMICPKCGWKMSIRHRMYPDLDNMLRASDRYVDKLIYETFR